MTSTTQQEHTKRIRNTLVGAIGIGAANTRVLADAAGVSVRTALYHLQALEAGRVIIRHGTCTAGIIWVVASSDLGQVTRFLAGETVEDIARWQLKRARQGVDGYVEALTEKRREVEVMLRGRLGQPGPSPLRRVARR